VVRVELGVVERGGAAEQWGTAAHGGGGAPATVGGQRRVEELPWLEGELGGGLVRAERGWSKGLRVELPAAVAMAGGAPVRERERGRAGRLLWVVGDRFRVSARVEGVGKWGRGAEVWAAAMAALFRRGRWPGWLTGGSGRWSGRG
jgi:hypothetical protein